ncbi:MAG: hypothetical protein R3C32_08980 [Chloroflexota bacterium]
MAYMWSLANEVAKAGVGCTVCTVYDPLIDTTLTGDALLADDNRIIESWTWLTMASPPPSTSSTTTRAGPLPGPAGALQGHDPG